MTAFLFDLDGTLLDTALDFTYAMQQLLEKNNLSISNKLETTLRAQASHGSLAMIATAFNLPKNHPKAKIYQSEFISIYKQNLFNKTLPFPGIPACLDKLEALKIPWGIVTNKRSELAHPILELWLKDKKPRCVVCADDVTSPKPHPEPILKACKLLKASPSTTFFIGDAEVDILAGKAAGVKTITALYGYIPDVATAKKWQADFTISHPEALLPFILEKKIYDD